MISYSYLKQQQKKFPLLPHLGQSPSTFILLNMCQGTDNLPQNLSDWLLSSFYSVLELNEGLNDCFGIDLSYVERYEKKLKHET